jgi:Flp/Fap pilin component.
MSRIKNAVASFIADEEGVVLIEYVILVVFIAVLAIVAIGVFGAKISTKFSTLGAGFL